MEVDEESRPIDDNDVEMTADKAMEKVKKTCLSTGCINLVITRKSPYERFHILIFLGYAGREKKEESRDPKFA